MKDGGLERVVSELRAYGAVGVLGAGVSYLSGYPLARDLKALVWHAIETDPEALDAIASKLGVARVSAKRMIGDREESVRTAFEVMEHRPQARLAFQEGFASLDRDRCQYAGPAHDALARLLHARVVERAISLNWDTATQFAYLCRYGRFLDTGSGQFDKPHGDATDPTSPWVLPHQPGGIPDALKAQIDRLTAERPRVLLVVGYSERDEGIVDQLIAPLEDRWRVVRIGPSATGPLALRGLADDLLPILASRLIADPELPGWEYVSFEAQRDLGAALIGESLGPRDVEACPALPEVAEVAQRLRVAGVAVLEGDSGSGKSISLYQAAFDRHREGWEIVRLVEYSDPGTAVASLRAIKHPTVAIIDNAQALPSEFTDRVTAAAGPQLGVLIASTEATAVSHARISIARGRAVEVLASAMRANRAAVLRLVRQLDRRVGDGYLDEPLDHRIAAAAMSEYPWQFSFVLTGGELRARQHLAELRDRNREDLLVAGLAVGQLLTLDTGVSRGWLHAFAAEVGEDAEWVDRGLEELRSRRLLLEGASLRLVHLRYAAVVLREIGDRYRDPAVSRFSRGLEWALVREDAPLRGISWLLFELRLALTFRFPDQSLITTGTIEVLLARCWTAGTQYDRSMACLVVDGLLHAGPTALDSVRVHPWLLSEWLEAIEAHGAPGMARLLNDVGQEDHALTEAICRGADPAVIGRRLSEATLDDTYAWGDLLGRLGYAASRDWIAGVEAALDIPKLASTSAGLDFERLVDFDELVKGMWSVSLEFALDLIEAALDPLAACYNRAPAEATARSHDLLWFALGFAPDFLRREEPGKRQAALAKALVAKFEPSAVARAVSGGSVRTWHELHPLLAFITEVDPSILTRIADTLDMTALEEVTRGLWETMPQELVVILHLVAERTDPTAGAELVQRHVGGGRELDPILAVLNPTAVATAVNGGAALRLRRGIKSWGGAALALRRLDEVDHGAAVRVLESSHADISKGFELPDSESCERLGEFVGAVDGIAAGFVDEVVDEIREQAEASWQEREAGTEAEQEAVTLLRGRGMLAGTSV
jgi:hypothetical protein